MQEYSRSLGDVIKRARGKLGLTQNEVADAADIDVRTVLNIENYKGNPKNGSPLSTCTRFENRRKGNLQPGNTKRIARASSTSIVD